MKRLALTAIAGAGLALGAGNARAQDKTLVIYGNDRCPTGTICVRAPESDRYRIPQSLRSGALPPADQPWAQRASAASRAGSASGIGSCSPVGPGGSIGCTQQMLRQARDERRQAASAAAGSATPDYTASSQVTSETPR